MLLAEKHDHTGTRQQAEGGKSLGQESATMSQLSATHLQTVTYFP
jgi:hypothetical protein